MSELREIDYEAVVESLLYVAGDEGVKPETIAYVIDKTKEDVMALLVNLTHRYESEHSGLELVNYGGSYKLVTKQLMAPFIKKLLHEEKNNALSQSALETLAIIAYKQPITRVEIEELRGVGAEMMLKKLLAKGLIKEAGRSEAPGRPILYEVTEEFMDSFKLENLDELPDLPQYSKKDNESLFD